MFLNLLGIEILIILGIVGLSVAVAFSSKMLRISMDNIKKTNKK